MGKSPVSKYQWSRETMVRSFNDRVMPVSESGCWLWMGALNYDGYGRVEVGGKKTQAHRFSYELAKGKIPNGNQLDHLCRVRACVNPSHLEAVTPRVNALRSRSPTAINAKKTHCKNGHEFNEVHTYARKNGNRMCRTCYNARKRSR